MQALVAAQNNLIARWIGHTCPACGDTPLFVPPGLDRTEMAVRAKRVRAAHEASVELARVRERRGSSKKGRPGGSGRRTGHVGD